MEKDKNDISLHSEAVQEVMGEIPKGIIRWGSAVIFIIIAILIIGSCFFKYPDFINAEITVTSVRPPAVIIARATGKIDKLYVVNQQRVDSGMPLAVIENPASYDDVKLLEHKLVKWKTNNIVADATSNFLKLKDLKLGAIQPYYAEFLSALQNYTEYNRVNYYPKKISLEENQLGSRKAHIYEVYRQRRILKMQLETSINAYRRDSSLYRKKLASTEELEISRSKLLTARQNLSSLDAAIKEAEIELSQTNESILDLNQNKINYGKKYFLDLQSSYERLWTEIRAWEQEYLLVSTVEGKVNLMGNWSENQNIESGETIFTVTPLQESVPVGKALVPAQGAGKVKEGQIVQVMFNNFPEQEFGLVEGVVSNISEVPMPDGKYVAEIKFPQRLKTNYSVSIPATGTLLGNAEIITEEKSLLVRLIMPVKRSLKRHS